MNTDEKFFEETSPITFLEFKAFMFGLIQGKQGKLPDFDDWVKIKHMMDRVVPEQKDVPFFPNLPHIPPMDYTPFKTLPYEPAPWWVNPITCDNTQTVVTSTMGTSNDATVEFSLENLDNALSGMQNTQE